MSGPRPRQVVLVAAILLAATPMALILVALAAPLLGARVVGAGYYSVPSGSMKPAILPGDRVMTARMSGEPARGQVVVYRHPGSGHTHIARVIGLPGERVAVENGVPSVDGAPAEHRPAPDFVEPFVFADRILPMCQGQPRAGDPCVKAALVEAWPDAAPFTVLDVGKTRGDILPPTEVPAAHVFLLGDNRDNALDSRFPLDLGGLGFVPVANVFGRVTRVHYSLGPGGPRTERTWLAVE